MPTHALTIITHCDLAQSPAIIWQGITDAVMQVPKPWCFNLGVPLPVRCEITSALDGVGKTRRCTSDQGSIEQAITAYVPGQRLAFAMVSHDLRTVFRIGHMADEFTFMPLGDGRTRLKRETHIEVPPGPTVAIRSWAIRRSVENVHRYVYANIRMRN